MLINDKSNRRIVIIEEREVRERIDRAIVNTIEWDGNLINLINKYYP